MNYLLYIQNVIRVKNKKSWVGIPYSKPSGPEHCFSSMDRVAPYISVAENDGGTKVNKELGIPLLQCNIWPILFIPNLFNYDTLPVWRNDQRSKSFFDIEHSTYPLLK